MGSGLTGRRMEMQLEQKPIGIVFLLKDQISISVFQKGIGVWKINLRKVSC